MILLLLACHAPTWTEATALAPIHARLDRDGDGAVTAAEFDAVGGAEDFARIDADRDARIGPDELAAFIVAQDPAFLPPAPPPPPPRPAPKHRLVWLVLDALRQEVLAKDPTASVPDDARLEAADDLGGFATPEARALLAELEEASARVGAGFPRALSQRR